MLAASFWAAFGLGAAAAAVVGLLAAAALVAWLLWDVLDWFNF